MNEGAPSPQVGRPRHPGAARTIHQTEPAGGDALASLARSLSEAVRPGDVLDVLADAGRPLLHARSINISLLDAASERLQLVVSRRSSPQVRMQFATIPVDAPLPTRDALRTRLPVLVTSLQDRDTRHPALAHVEVDQCCWAVLPLIAGGRVLRTVGLGWVTPQDFTAEQVQLCQQVASLTAGALARAQLFDDQEQARAAAEDLSRRLTILQTLTERLAEATDLAAVGDLVVGAGLQALDADAATIGLLDHGRTFTALASVGVHADLLPRWSTRDVSDSGQVRDLLANLRPVVVTSHADRDARYPDQGQAGDTFEASAILPLVSAGTLVGVVAYAWKTPRTFDAHDLDYLSAVASNAATAIDRCGLLERSHQVAETLQRALLPEAVTDLDGWDLATCYVPAVEGTRVGGDWYDAFSTTDGRVVLVLGDVAGKGIRAAAVMGAVRSALRAYATLDPTPATVLAHLDQYFAAFKAGEMVAVAVAVLEPATGDLTYASAGHLPPLLVGEGMIRWLDQATSPPLGANDGAPREQAAEHLTRGQVLLLYSDGLVEQRDEDLDQSLDRLAATAHTLPGCGDLRTATDALIQQLASPTKVIDDTALLALRRHPRG